MTICDKELMMLLDTEYCKLNDADLTCQRDGIGISITFSSATQRSSRLG